MDKEKKYILSSLLLLILLVIGIYSFFFIDFKVLSETIEQLPFFLKMLALMGLMILQIVIAFLPGEPLELASGYLFGPWLGTLLCLFSAAIGTLVIYGLVKVFHSTVIDCMFSSKKVEEVQILLSNHKSQLWLFVFFLVPGSPKDVLTYLLSRNQLHLGKWILITTIGRIPSVVTSTFLSSSFKEGKLQLAIFIFLLTVVLTISGVIYYRKQLMKENQ